ncbi:MAG: ferredoxin [Candidatus Aenigmarchaeota archaeon]|nr:ferredoxin [Candidatus Aenigmarchaeota archaeon]
MATYKIIYDREACIGAGVCAAVADKVWVMNDDGKADLVGGKEENGKWVREIDESELEANKQAAEGCPAVVIEIVNKDTDEKVFPK